MEQREFKRGDMVMFRESEQGKPMPGYVTEVYPPDEEYPEGGLYRVYIDEEQKESEVYWTELMPHPDDLITDRHMLPESYDEDES